MAFNDAGSNEYKLMIKVHQQLSAQEVQCNPKRLGQVPNYRVHVTLDCYVKYAFPFPDLSWHFVRSNGLKEPVFNNYKYQWDAFDIDQEFCENECLLVRLTIFNVDSADYGMYTLVASTSNNLYSDRNGGNLLRETVNDSVTLFPTSECQRSATHTNLCNQNSYFVTV
ncbi:hypothetical protein ACOME3_004397 [Neoechinorhynchus agilis]